MPLAAEERRNLLTCHHSFTTIPPTCAPFYHIPTQSASIHAQAQQHGPPRRGLRRHRAAGRDRHSQPRVTVDGPNYVAYRPRPAQAPHADWPPSCTPPCALACVPAAASESLSAEPRSPIPCRTAQSPAGITSPWPRRSACRPRPGNSKPAGGPAPRGSGFIRHSPPPPASWAYSPEPVPPSQGPGKTQPLISPRNPALHPSTPSRPARCVPRQRMV